MRPICLLEISRHAKSVGIIAHILIVSEARGRAYHVRFAGEWTTAQATLLALTRRPSGTVGGSAAIGFVPAILNPLRRIARHVKKPETVGPKRSRRQRLSQRRRAAILTIGIAADGGAAPPELRGRTGARCVFPLSFGGQPISLLGFLRQPHDKCLGIVPADINDRTIATSPTVVIGPVIASSRCNAEVPLLEGVFSTSDRKRTGNDDSVLGLLIWGGARAHFEVTGRYHHHLRTVRAIVKNLARFRGSS